jgi:hypothetical protein
MPRGDGTGPMGIGPNGWGRGGCRGFAPTGGSFGFGRGMRWRQAMPYQQAMPNQQSTPDAELLEERAEMLERQAAACRAAAKKAKDAGAKAD